MEVGVEIDFGIVEEWVKDVTSFSTTWLGLSTQGSFGIGKSIEIGGDGSQKMFPIPWWHWRLWWLWCDEEDDKDGDSGTPFWSRGRLMVGRGGFGRGGRDWFWEERQGRTVDFLLDSFLPLDKDRKSYMELGMLDVMIRIKTSEFDSKLPNWRMDQKEVRVSWLLTGVPFDFRFPIQGQT